jgi:hypothetical protein
MKTPIVSASKIINAPAGQIYNLIADYREGHTAILPKSYFSALEVEEGGYGEGTVIRYQMRILGRTRSFRARIGNGSQLQYIHQFYCLVHWA